MRFEKEMASSTHTPSKVLIVDDFETNVIVLSGIIEDMGLEPIEALSAREAVEIINTNLPDLILLDVFMPEMNGYQLCEKLKSNVITREIPIIFVSGNYDEADMKKAFELGAVDFIHKPYEFGKIAMCVNTHLKMYEMQKKMEENNKRLNKVVQEQSEKIHNEQKRLLKALSNFAEGSMDFDNGHHMEYVAYNARLLSQALNFTDRYENSISSTFVEAMELAAAIHDIGKLMIPREVANKPAKLTEEEMNIMRTHTTCGYEMLESIYEDLEENLFIQVALDLVQYHHERWDGSGYPKGLKGEEIPLVARIFTIVDSYDSMMGERCYKKAMTREEALEVMHSDHAKQFDPYILDVFFKIERQLKKETGKSEAAVYD